MDLRDAIITDISEACTVYSTKGRFEEMRNRKAYGLTLCVDGQITYIQNGIEYVSQRNVALILPKEANYYIRGDKTGLFPVINFECSAVLCDTIMVIPIHNTEQLLTDFEEIKRLICFEGNRARIFSIFYGMLHKLSRLRLPPLLENALQIISHEYCNPNLTNVRLSEACQISEVYLRKLFSTHLYISPKQYIMDLRLQKAKQLLEEGALSITAISEQSGFSNPYHFCRIFKEHTGVTPSEYRKENVIVMI